MLNSDDCTHEWLFCERYVGIAAYDVMEETEDDGRTEYLLDGQVRSDESSDVQKQWIECRFCPAEREVAANKHVTWG